MPEVRGTKVRHTRQAAAIIAVLSRMPAFSGAGFNAVLCQAGPCTRAATSLLRHLGAATRRPVVTEEDAFAVADWLTGGGLDTARLEPRLRLPVRGIR